MFWLTLPWAAIGDELGVIRVLDAGCGSGGYGPRLLSWADGQIATYTGTDAHRDNAWAALEAGDRRLRFFRSRAENFRSSIPAGTNMFISQSAVEHFDEDLGFFEQIRDYVRATQGPVLQVHLVPSQACLGLYHLHGARQYTPRTLSHITRLFGPDTHALLYRLGGRASNRVHYSFITKPLLILGGTDLRNEQPDEYDRRLFDAISDDMRRPQRSPVFWALAIHSRWNKRVFS
ncbi:MAG: class I SAM-dependent methyltransferase [Acidobacteria bacterium]|nr:class I SAM-dependent methyltransferase [Acidobacteriota bacterium]